MLPSGAITEETVTRLGALMEAGDIVIDGGNSSAGRHPPRRRLRGKGVHYVDIGTSGGVWGRERGYCMMVGGDAAAVDRLTPILEAAGAGAARSSGRRARPGRSQA